MNQKVITFNKEQREKKAQNLRAGDIVRVHRKIKEGGKERIQIFEGMIISVKGGQSSSPMITVRKVSHGRGVEIIVPVIAPMIEKIELVKRAAVRKSKLYYIRKKSAKALRFKFKDIAAFAASEKEEENQAETVEEKPEEAKEEKKIEKVEASEKQQKKKEVKADKAQEQTNDSSDKESEKKGKEDKSEKEQNA